ncbi:hypothetical protein [Mucilaginibacter sp. UYCu711]|uniref:hypothetical protein n=1 Tax=Mucilaginibacter sp. UYCu711 TaxID=3156339 RepID=UPI003D1AC44B
MKIIKFVFCAIVAIFALTLNFDNVTTKNYGVKNFIGAKAFADPPPPPHYDRTCTSTPMTCTKTVTHTVGASAGASAGVPGVGSANAGVSGSGTVTETVSYTLDGNRCTCATNPRGTFTHCTPCESVCDPAATSCPVPTVTI